MIGEVPFRPRSTDQFAFDWLNFEPPRGLFYVRVVGVDEDYNVFYRMSQTALSAVLPGLLYYIYYLVELVHSGKEDSDWFHKHSDRQLTN